MDNFVQWCNGLFSQVSQYWHLCDKLFSQYQAWFLPGTLVLFALIGLVLLRSELRHYALDRRKWRASH